MRGSSYLLGTPYEARAKALVEFFAGRTLPVWKTFASAVVVHHMDAGDPLPQHHQPMIFYVSSGLVKLSLTHDGQERLVRFAQPHQLAVSGSAREIASLMQVNLTALPMSGVVDHIPREGGNRMSGEMLIGGELVGFPAHVLAELARNHVAWSTVLTTGALMFSSFYVDRWIEAVSLTAEERYLKFVTENPELVKLITQKSMAEYLQMTPAALSRLISRLRERHAETTLGSS